MPKFIKVTKAQYETLKSGTAVGGHSYDSTAIYLVQDTSTFSWTNGTASAGPTGAIASSTGESISVPAIPLADGTHSGVLSAGVATQYIGGPKVFNDSPMIKTCKLKSFGGNDASFPTKDAFTFLGCTAALTIATDTVSSSTHSGISSHAVINTGSKSDYDILIQWGTCEAEYNSNSTTRSLFSILFSKAFADEFYRIVVTPRWKSSSTTSYPSLMADVQYALHTKTIGGALGYALNTDSAYKNGGVLYFDYIAIGNVAKATAI